MPGKETIDALTAAEHEATPPGVFVDISNLHGADEKVAAGAKTVDQPGASPADMKRVANVLKRVDDDDEIVRGGQRIDAKVPQGKLNLTLSLELLPCAPQGD